MKPHLLPLSGLLAAIACCPMAAQDLQIDFCNLTSTLKAGWQAYRAADKVQTDFNAKTFSAFGGTDNITVTPTWTGSPLASQNPRMIVRTQTSPDNALYQDFIAIDNRAPNNFPGDPMTITVTGVPAGTYRWRSYHHDPNDQTGLINLTITDKDGATLIENFDQSNAATTPATFERVIRSDGVAAITLKLDCLQTGNNTGFSILNGFEIIDLDTDKDGLLDLWEDQYFGDDSGTVEPDDLTPQDGTGNPDDDGLDNLGEQAAGTDPTDPDSDDDEITDGEEVTTGADGYVTNPLANDTDGDTLRDGEETSGSVNPFTGGVQGTPPGDPTNPILADTDGDAVNDAAEIFGDSGWITDPNAADSDGDGYNDGYEIANTGGGFDPTVDDSAADFDGDLLDNAGELAAGTNPLLADTDGDGRTDGEEVTGPPTSNPLLVDTDGDLIGDGDEVNNGVDPADPNDKADYPKTPHLQVAFADMDGPLQLFYQPYLAIQETNSLDSDPVGGDANGVDRLSQPFVTDLLGTVNLSVSYPDLDRVSFTEDQLRAVKQMYDRGAGLAANYLGTKSALVRSWIGTDARTVSFGNGTAVPTTLRLQLDGVPAGSYLLRTYHHDAELQHGLFGIRVTDADSADQLLSDRFRITQSSPSLLVTNYDDPGPGNGPELLRSTVEQVVRSNGTDPIVLDFQKTELPAALEAEPGRSSFFLLNGLELNTVADSDNDDLPDDVETAIFGDLATSDGTTDTDDDGLSDLTELLLNLDPKDDDSDGDGLADGLETDARMAGAGAVTITDFTFIPATEAVSLDWLPAVTGTVVAGTDLADFPEVAASMVTPPASFYLPAALSGSPNAFFRVLGPPPGTGTDPYDADTDNDGVSDGDEANTYASDPLDNDSDDDGFIDGHEVYAGSDPTLASDLPDRDGDGYNNATETAGGSSPDDPNSVPVPSTDVALYVDFNSNQDDGGDSATNTDPALSTANHNQKGYQSYHANHEVLAEFTTANYTAFGATVTLTPTWPDTTANTVMQSIDRTDQDAAGVVVGGNDAQWKGDQINLLTDWIGCDTRTSVSGNGNYDGVTGTPTRLELTLGGLPAGTYDWRSFHHDTENVWSDFQMEVSTDGGLTYGAPIGPFGMSCSTGTGTPAAPSDRIQRGYPTNQSPLPEDMSSVVTTTFTADGFNNVVVRFTPLTDTNTHRQFWGINGFHLTRQPD